MTGYARTRVGEAHHNAKLTEEKVKELRRLVEEVGVCIVCAAKLMGVSKGAAWDAARYVTWRHVR
jgi:molybdenum-dependent DNA-binding transcriptional regulator ModE